MQALDTGVQRWDVRGGYAILARRPLFLAFVLGCGVSMLGSGRLTLRLIADGALSFAFVPLAELLGFVIAYSKSRPATSAKATVARERDEQVYGDPDLIRIAEADGRLRKAASTEYPVSALDRVSQILGIVGLAVIVRRR